MKKHELIKRAYDDYPAGTIYLWGKTQCISTGKFEFNYSWIVNEDNLPVFDGVNWAPIVNPNSD